MPKPFHDEAILREVLLEARAAHNGDSEITEGPIAGTYTAHLQFGEFAVHTTSLGEGGENEAETVLVARNNHLVWARFSKFTFDQEMSDETAEEVFDFMQDPLYAQPWSIIPGINAPLTDGNLKLTIESIDDKDITIGDFTLRMLLEKVAQPDQPEILLEASHIGGWFN